MNQLPNSVPESREAWNQEMADKERLKEAIAYIDTCYKEGYIEIGMLDGMTNAQLIEWAEDTMAKADANADALRKNEDEDPRVFNEEWKEEQK